jgi:peptide/nickel transport system substrate-binding protein
MMRQGLVTVVCAAVLVVSCTSGGADRGDATTPVPRPWRGGTLRISDWNRRFFLDPTKAFSAGTTTAELLHCCLARTLISFVGRPFEDGGSEPRPDLAISLPHVSDDGLTWTFHMREGLRYGPPLEDREIVANDVVRALERTADPDLAAFYASFYSVIDGYDAVRRGRAEAISGLHVPDPHTLVVRLVAPAGDLPYRFSLPATAPIPRDAADGHEDYGRFLVSTGPYMYEGSEAMDPTLPAREQIRPSGYARTFTFVRNPSWDPVTDPLRPAYVDSIVIENHAHERKGEPYLDFYTALQARSARQVDTGVVDLTLATLQSPAQVRRYLTDPTLRARLLTGRPDAATSAPFNLAVAPFDDVHVRRAVTLAFDRARVVESLNAGQDWVGATAMSHLAPDGAEALLLSTFRPSWDTGDVPDRVAARREMRRSRYDRDGDGLCEGASCRDVIVLVEKQALYHPRPSRLASRALESVGMRPRFVTRSYGPLFRALGTPGERWGMSLCLFCSGWLSDFPGASSQFLAQFYGPSITPQENSNESLMGATTGQLHRWGYTVDHVPSVDRRIEACERAVGSTQTACWARLDQYLMERVLPRMPLFSEMSAFPMSARVASASFDQFVGLPALDRVALVPGSE